MGLNSFYINAEGTLKGESTNHFNVTLATEFGYLDNFLYQAEGELSTRYWRLSPNADLQVVNGQQLYSLALKSDVYQFNQFSDDDLSENKLHAGYRYKFSPNQSFWIDVDHQQQYEARGTGLSLGEANTLLRPDEHQRNHINLGFLYGSNVSVAKLWLNGGFWQKRYDTRRNLTRRLDQNTTYLRIAFDYLLSGKTFITSEASVADAEFNNNSTLNEQKWEGLIGLRWQSTDITRISTLIGYQYIDFELPTLANDNSFKWKVDASWDPNDYFSLALTSSRDYVGTNRLTDSYRVVDKYQISAKYLFTEHVVVSAFIAVDNETLNFVKRQEKEDYLVGQVELLYNSSEWLSFFGKFDFRRMDNVNPMLNYQRNSFSIGFSVSI